jgi:hypothetical protein
LSDLPGRPKVGEPHVTTLSSLVCIGPLILSAFWNWIVTQEPLRWLRGLSQPLTPEMIGSWVSHCVK